MTVPVKLVASDNVSRNYTNSVKEAIANYFAGRTRYTVTCEIVEYNYASLAVDCTNFSQTLRDFEDYMYFEDELERETEHLLLADCKGGLSQGHLGQYSSRTTYDYDHGVSVAGADYPNWPNRGRGLAIQEVVHSVLEDGTGGSCPDTSTSRAIEHSCGEYNTQDECSPMMATYEPYADDWNLCSQYSLSGYSRLISECTQDMTNAYHDKYLS